MGHRSACANCTVRNAPTTPCADTSHISRVPVLHCFRVSRSVGWSLGKPLGLSMSLLSLFASASVQGRSRGFVRLLKLTVFISARRFRWCFSSGRGKENALPDLRPGNVETSPCEVCDSELVDRRQFRPAHSTPATEQNFKPESVAATTHH